MPKTLVEIEWDKPDEKEWLNVFNIRIALSQCCPNTKFIVKEVKGAKLSHKNLKNLLFLMKVGMKSSADIVLSEGKDFEIMEGVVAK
jgi:hypothetical protein